MIFYLILFLVLIPILALADKKNKNQKYYLFAFFSILALTSGLRGDVGQDTLSYQKIFDNSDSIPQLFSGMEPVLPLIAFLTRRTLDSYTAFLLIVSIIQFSLLAYATRNIEHRLLFFVFYLPAHFFQQHLNVLRAGLAVCFFLAALSNTEEKHYNLKNATILYALAIFSHLSILITIPIIITRLKTKNISKKLAIFAILIVISVCLNIDYIAHKIETYNIFSTYSITSSKTNLALALIIFIYLIIMKNNRALITSSILLLLSLLASDSIEHSYRIINIFEISTLYLFCETKIQSINHSEKTKPLPTIPIISLFSLTLLFSVIAYKEINYVINERSIREVRKTGNLNFTYIPYNLYFESEYRYK